MYYDKKRMEVMTMPLNALAIANAFIDEAKKHNATISPMKLQKLIFFAHGWYLALFDEPLLDEMVEAWEYGPVIPSVYHEFKKFGNNPITEKATVFEYGSNNKLNINIAEASIPESPEKPKVSELISKIWEVYGHLSAIQISKLTHIEGSPWHETVKKHNRPLPKNLDINPDVIKDYFKSKLENTNE